MRSFSSKIAENPDLILAIFRIVQTLDPGIESMRGLFTQLNWQGIEIDVSTFSKANKNRDPEVFQQLFESFFTDEDIKKLYRQRWQIELLWKFLKMHLKLDRIIPKNTNGITIQIYTCLIAYLFLQLLETYEYSSRI